MPYLFAIGIVTLDAFRDSYLLFLTILKLNGEKYLNSCEDKEFTRRKVNCIYIYFSRAKALIESFNESIFKFLKFFHLIFNFSISLRQEKTGGKWFQGVIHNCDDFNFHRIL